MTGVANFLLDQYHEPTAYACVRDGIVLGRST